MRRVLFIFVDGLGIGADDPASNPIVAARTPYLNQLLGRKLAAIHEPVDRNGALIIPTDTTLGVEGLPQSATGQTALLTGVNAPQAIGRHVTAYPTRELREILAGRNIFKQIRDAGGQVALANAYTPEYFDAVENGRLRHGAITFSALSADIRLRNLDDLRAGRAVFHDLVNARPRSWGYEVPEIAPSQAGRNLAGIAAEHHLTLFEFFLTDLAAHGRVPLTPVAVVELLDAFLKGAIEAADVDSRLVIVTSDHGNLEDSRAETHTRNPVPTILIGSDRHEVGERIRSITDITPAIVEWLSGALTHG